MAAMNIKLQGYGTSDGVSAATEKYAIEGAKGSTQLLEAVAGHCAAKAAEHASIPGKAVPYMLVVQAVHKSTELGGTELERLSASGGGSTHEWNAVRDGNTTAALLASRLGATATGTGDAGEAKTEPPLTPADLGAGDVNDSGNGNLTTELEKRQAIALDDKARKIRELEEKVKALTHAQVVSEDTTTPKETEKMIARRIMEELSSEMTPGSAASHAFHEMCKQGRAKIPVVYIRAAETLLFTCIHTLMDPQAFRTIATPDVIRAQDGAHLLFKIVTRAKKVSSYAKQAALQALSEEKLQEGDTIGALFSRVERHGHMLESSGMPREVVYELQKNRITTIMVDTFDDNGIPRFTNFEVIKRDANSMHTWGEYKDFIESATQSPGWNKMLTALYQATTTPTAMAANTFSNGRGNGGGGGGGGGRGGDQAQHCSICNGRYHKTEDCNAAKRPCYRILKNGKCNRKNCPYVHDGPIMVAEKAKADKRTRRKAKEEEKAASVKAAVADVLSAMGYMSPAQDLLGPNQYHTMDSDQHESHDSSTTDGTSSGRH
jgi:hypothetical protein